MKINLNTLEAEGTPQEIHELMERIVGHDEPGQDIGPVRIEKMKTDSLIRSESGTSGILPTGFRR